MSVELIEIVLVAALAVLAYTYVGYPSLIWVLARCFPRAVHRGAYEPRVAVIIVAHNEAARIVRKLDTCIALDYPKEKLRILVASDGSDDELLGRRPRRNTCTVRDILFLPEVRRGILVQRPR